MFGRKNLLNSFGWQATGRNENVFSFLLGKFPRPDMTIAFLNINYIFQANTAFQALHELMVASPERWVFAVSTLFLVDKIFSR